MLICDIIYFSALVSICVYVCMYFTLKSLIKLYFKILLKSFYIPGTILVTGNKSVKKTWQKPSVLLELTLQGKTDNKQ